MAIAAVAPINIQSAQSRADLRSGKYLILELGDEEFGISVMQVKEIMKMQEITTVPQTPRFLQGVINLRGRIVPVVSLRSKFHMARSRRQRNAHASLWCACSWRMANSRWALSWTA